MKSLTRRMVLAAGAAAMIGIGALAPAAAEDVKPLKIGLLLSLSGPAAPFGIPERDAVKALFLEATAGAGIRAQWRTPHGDADEALATCPSVEQCVVVRRAGNEIKMAEGRDTWCVSIAVVEAGVSVELVRSARHHGGDGNWGDLLVPVIVTQARDAA